MLLKNIQKLVNISWIRKESPLCSPKFNNTFQWNRILHSNWWQWRGIEFWYTLTKIPWKNGIVSLRQCFSFVSYLINKHAGFRVSWISRMNIGYLTSCFANEQQHCTLFWMRQEVYLGNTGKIQHVMVHQTLVSTCNNW